MYKGGEMVRGKFVVAHTIFFFFSFLNNGTGDGHRSTSSRCI